MAQPIETPPLEPTLRKAVNSITNTLGSAARRVSDITLPFLRHGEHRPENASPRKEWNGMAGSYSAAESLRGRFVDENQPVFIGCVKAGETVTRLTQEPDCFG